MRTIQTLALLAVAAACGSETRPGGQPAPLVEEPVPAFESTAVVLDSASALAEARAIEDSVKVTLAPGLSLSLWASSRLINDPIAISIDSLGRAFVTQTSRTDNAEIDIRGHQDWMVESITFRTVADKDAFYRRELAPERSAENEWLADANEDGSRDWRDLTVHKESIHRIEDRSGDGVADFSQKILEGFNDVVSDVAHGILAYDDQLILTLSPDVWRLKDTDGDGAIDTRVSLARGSGVHIGFGGHGLSNPIIGPDGRLYWKMGDLGLDYTSQEGEHLANPNSGTIIRAEPDGTGMEIFATGLRNPQEFAFDEYGNIISADNDGDHPGEMERIVYIPQGSDAGWRINWQFGKYVDPDNNDYKVWMDEELFKPRFEGQAAYITAPIANYHAGPSGFVYNPGTALSDEWKDYFFVSIFPGQPGGARIHGFKLSESGAGFELADDREMLRGVLAVGIDFGPDGALYLTDWDTGWAPNDQGRLWKLDTPATAGSAAREETQRLIAEPFTDRPVTELVRLLAHADMRVRTKAQFHLVNRGASGELRQVAASNPNQLARIHAIWGVGQLARRSLREAEPLVALLRDGDPEVRAQAAKVLGDVRYADAADQLVALLEDPAPRARFFAAEALGRLAYAPAIQPIVTMLAENDDRDQQLRHAGATALARIGDAAAVGALSTHPSRAVRIAAVVALRRMRSPEVGRFMRDADEYIVAEAARAINDDGGIEGARPALAAALAEQRFTSEPLLRRALNANLRLGTADAADRVAAFALRTGVADELLGEAVAILGVWPAPSILDRVDGWHIGVMEHDTTVARNALSRLVDPLFSNGSPAVQVALAEAVGRLRLASAAPVLLAKVDQGGTPDVRIAALNALAAMGDPRFGEALRTALQDPETPVRMAALAALTESDLPEATAVELLSTVIRSGSVAEQQAALAALGGVRGETGREALTQLTTELVAGRIAPAIQLDVAEAARASGNAAVLALLEPYETQRAASPNPLVAYADLLTGGDARAGQRVVFQHPAAQCTRCHTLGGALGGAEVGPPLRGIGGRLTREQLLEALVAPSARIAPGFGTPGTPSAMPPMNALLSRREIRDVVEFLSTLR